ncbi:hypothetical protein FRB99_002466, partial [Tulasnella sp. 403]
QLRQDKALPVLELADLKDRDLFDNLGCWSILQKVESDPQEKQVTLFDRDRFQPGRDVSYLSVPSWTLLPRSNQFCKFSSLSRLSFPTGRRLALESEETVNGETATKVVPHERLMCFDSLYRVVEDDVFEWDQDYSPVWNVVGQYLYFKPSVMRLAAKYLLRMFGLPEDATVPPFIAIHVTSRPSHQKGADSIHMDDTRAWISTPELAAYVEQVALEIAKETGFTITKTIVYSDIADPVWWKEVEDLGWFTVDHELEKTVEEYSSSYVEIIDATIQSMSAGFIGMADSTFSIMSQKRVQEWVGGPTKMTIGIVQIFLFDSSTFHSLRLVDLRYQAMRNMLNPVGSPAPANPINDGITAGREHATGCFDDHASTVGVVDLQDRRTVADA